MSERQSPQVPFIPLTLDEKRPLSSPNSLLSSWLWL